MDRIIMLWILIACVKCKNKLAPDGCERDWRHFNDYCYLTVAAHVHFDSAKAVCTIKDSDLVSLWKQSEVIFVTDQLKKISDVKAWIGSSVVRYNRKKQWGWLDGSGSIDLLDKGQELPPVSDETCGYISVERGIDFESCDIMLPAFICKKPIQKLYIPDTMNITHSSIYLTKNPVQTIFERLWPPLLEEINIDLTSSYHLATIDVSQETDCAYRCYTVLECKAFIVTCKSSRKCTIRHCSLFTGFDKTFF